MRIKVEHKITKKILDLEIEQDNPDVEGEVLFEGDIKLQQLFLVTCKGIPGAFGHIVDIRRTTPRDLIAVVAQLKGWRVLDFPLIPSLVVPESYKT